MSRTFHAKTKDLPHVIQQTLKSVGYHKTDIAIRSSETVQSSPAAFEGSRSFLCIVNLTTGEHRITYGSWSGANPFERKIADDTTEHSLAHGVLAIVGEQGGRGTFATLLVHPSNLAAMVREAPTLSELDERILVCFRSYKSHYRKEVLASLQVTPADLDSLVARGLLKRTKSGATSITTEGKNAIVHVR